ncbi:MAG: PDDEXK nuclease domain-containing protein [Candidatus Aminicenantes bacterium]|nr:PDDEXK nuclease domain-containing protein [Candidatus Aminicenantes bacterium]
MNELTPVDITKTLHDELKSMIVQCRNRVTTVVNAELTQLYWAVGRRLGEEVLGGQRAQYGAKIVATLGEKLVGEFGRGFESKNLRRMIQFAETFPDIKIVVTLSRQLSWSHVVAILPIKNHEAREYYALTAANQGWGVRELRQRIQAKTYERVVIAGNQGIGLSQALVDLKNDGMMSPSLIFKDPYFLDFLNLHDSYNEKELEAAILRELESFILELGYGFAFIERQKRIIIDNEDFYIDLLFYHRRLRRLVAVELKLGRFKAAHKGQMELYLKWLDRYERQPGEDAPVGLILCAESSREQIELLEMHKDGIVVAEYWTELPPRAELERLLHQVMIEARERLSSRKCLQENGEEDEL